MTSTQQKRNRGVQALVCLALPPGSASGTRTPACFPEVTAAGVACLVRGWTARSHHAFPRGPWADPLDLDCPLSGVDPERLHIPLHRQAGQSAPDRKRKNTKSRRPPPPAGSFPVCTLAICHLTYHPSLYVDCRTLPTPEPRLVTQPSGTRPQEKRKTVGIGTGISPIPRLPPAHRTYDRRALCSPLAARLCCAPYGLVITRGQAAGGRRRRCERDPVWKRATRDISKG
jgi:hypothetical protein